MATLLSQALWYRRRCLKALGLWGLLGSVIMIGTLLFVYFTDITMPPLPPDEQQSSTDLAVLTTSDHRLLVQPESDADLRLNTLLAVMRLLPEERRLPSILNQMHEEAKRTRLSIVSADYKWRKLKKSTPFADGALVQYEITFPVKGSYTAIRNMLNKVLAQIPTLALYKLELNRETVTNVFAEARVTFVVFLIGKSE
ncbi:MAG: hypothetical protein KFB94_08365 [Methylophilaceae bacterium]|nr:MAG: hypothetical protein KFB94_08365 [Methylophilaceae bacterium]